LIKLDDQVWNERHERFLSVQSSSTYQGTTLGGGLVCFSRLKRSQVPRQARWIEPFVLKPSRVQRQQRQALERVVLLFLFKPSRIPRQARWIEPFVLKPSRVLLQRQARPRVL